jgi:hypothetical protein
VDRPRGGHRGDRTDAGDHRFGLGGQFGVRALDRPSRCDGQHVGAQRFQLAMQLLAGRGRDAHHGDHGGDADRDAQRGQQCAGGPSAQPRRADTDDIAGFHARRVEAHCDTTRPSRTWIRRSNSAATAVS